jgi:hypothetical protein
MSHLTRWAALLLLLLGLVVVPTSIARDDPKKDDTKKDDTKKDDTKKEEPKTHYYKFKQVVGKIVHVDEAKKLVKVSVETGPNQGALNELQNAQLAVQRARNVNDLNNAQIRLAKAQANLMVNPKKEDVEFTSIDEVKVRLVNPPPAFDDKGKPKKYTQKELDELKGPDKKTPGYPAEFGDLKRDMYVAVTLVTKKDVNKAPLKPKPEDMDDYKPLASMILADERVVPK